MVKDGLSLSDDANYSSLVPFFDLNLVYFYFFLFPRRDRIDPLVFQFQFKNVEYSSGRNKTFLCYLVDTGKANEGLQRGYLEDEHAGSHAEEAFFTQCLPHYDPALKYTVTWYMPPSHPVPLKIRN